MFLITILEGIPPLGFLVPGQNSVIAAGFLVGMDVFPFVVMLMFVGVGMWIGECLAYFL
jgi:membrane protein DedA with SNARE-associated domain